MEIEGNSNMPSGKLEDYVVLETIGSGSFGQCQKIRRKGDGKILVWKEIDYGTMTEVEKQQLVREVNLLREFRHPRIIRYYDRIIDKSHSKLYIVTEYCSGGDLAAVISKHKSERKYLSEEFIWKVIHQLLLALHECHKSKENEGGKVMHRDLKPANVFLDSEGGVKLGDFGLARILHNTSLAKTLVGTPYYMSPEQFSDSSYDHRSDLWSLGCLLYELCALRPPFTAMTQQKLAEHICIGRFARIPTQYSDNLHGVIASLLHTNPDRRPSISRLLVLVEERLLHDKLSQEKEAKKLMSEDELRRREGIIKKREEELHKREQEIKQREEAMAKRERQLLIRERQLTERQCQERR